MAETATFGPRQENAHAPWCTPENLCSGDLCDGTIERFILGEQGVRP